ncbi:MAG: phosphoenolpyruvate synthase [candidate division NC10 bacterium]|nr:phosphoenolpyruvate synthase [candidate division NC10 bacterium]
MASSRNRRFILWFEEIGADDAPLVGSKNALLGEVMRHLGRRGVRVPQGFVVTAQAYRHLVREAGLLSDLKRVLNGLDPRDPDDLALKAKQARDLFFRARFPSNLETEIAKAYWKLCSRTGSGEMPASVWASIVGEPAPETPAGLPDSLLNVRGEYAILDACRRSFASVFNGRAVAELVARRIDPVSSVLALGVQRMVRSDAACSGRMTGFDPCSGFPDVIVVQGAYGVWGAAGENGGSPDEFFVHKPTLAKGFRPVVVRHLGMKGSKWMPGPDPESALTSVPVLKRDRGRYILSDDEVLELARAAMAVETHLKRATELSWAKDGDGINIGTGMLFLLQVRPVVRPTRPVKLATYLVEPTGEPQQVLLRGTGVGDGIGCGKVKLVADAGRLNEFTVRSVLVTESTDPEWEQAMRAAAAVITVRGDRTSHASRFCSEQGLPCLVGAGPAAVLLDDGVDVTVDCRDEIGMVMKGRRAYRVQRVRAAELPGTKTELMLIAGPLDRAFFEAQYPIDGVGMFALDAIIEEQVGIHPFAFLDFDQLQERASRGLGEDTSLATLVEAIEKRAAPYPKKADWLVDQLSCAIGSFAAGSYREVSGHVKGDTLVRLSSLSSDRYLRLLGGDRYEPKSGDPLRDLRGSGRHCHPLYGRAFSLECQAIKRVRDEMGLRNVKVIVPLCRTPEEGRRLLALMGSHGLARGENGLEVYLQVQTPSNLHFIEQLSRLFDGFIVDAEDLSSLALGVGSIDHDPGLFREAAAAARRFCSGLLLGAKRHRPHRRVGFCVRDPEAIPSWVAFFAEMGADFVATRPSKLAITRVIMAYAELARQERKHLVLVETDPVTGRETVQLGVPPRWLKDRAKRWAPHVAGKVRELPAETRRAVATLLGAMTPRVQIDRPGEEREVFCWRVEDVDLAKEQRAKGVRSVKVRPIGSLNVGELLDVAHLWTDQARAAGRKEPATESAKIQGLVKRFENARAEFVAQIFATAVTELFRREMQQV